MANLVTNRIRIEVKDNKDDLIRKVTSLTSGASAEEVLSHIRDRGRAGVPFDPFALVPVPLSIKAIPDVLPKNIDLALAAQSKFDLVKGRYRRIDPMSSILPDYMLVNRQRVIEENRHARKSFEELKAWASENIPEAVEVAWLMIAATKECGHSDMSSWMTEFIGTRGLADTIWIEPIGDELVLGFDSDNVAPTPWITALAAALPEVSFTTFGIEEDNDFSITGVASGDGTYEWSESDDPNDLRRAKAGARGLLGKAKLDRDVMDEEDAVAIELAPLLQGLERLWVAMEDDEKWALLNLEPARNILWLGHLTDIPDEIFEDWDPACLEDLRNEHSNLRLTRLETWLRAAEQHAADTDEPENKLGDIYDLYQSCSEIMGEDRVSAALTTPFRDALKGLVEAIEKEAHGMMPDMVVAPLKSAKFAAYALEPNTSAWDPVGKVYSEDEHRALLEDLVSAMREQFGSNMPASVASALEAAESFLWHQEPRPGESGPEL